MVIKTIPSIIVQMYTVVTSYTLCRTVAVLEKRVTAGTCFNNFVCTKTIVSPLMGSAVPAAWKTARYHVYHSGAAKCSP